MKVPEEQPIGTTILMLSARDPVTGGPIFKFEELHGASLNDTEDFVSVGLQSGNVVLNKRLDYETMNQKACIVLSHYIKMICKNLGLDF